MNIVYAMFLSIGIKAISALIEIGIQLLITNNVGINGYGEYTFCVSLIEGMYWIMLSGSVKLNTFYLSSPECSLEKFKKLYFVKFVTPILSLIMTVFVISKNVYGCGAVATLLMYFLAYDRSSIFFSRGYQVTALLGEYLLGRLVMIGGLFICLKMNMTTGTMLLLLYGSQYVIMLIWFMIFEKKLPKGTLEVNVPLKKLWEYQKSDIANFFITYSPAIIQYIIGGAFTAGFTGIISIVKKFINFISGPTAKVFLPEFSRLYKSGDKEKLQRSYLMIVRIQMVFIGVISTALVGFPDLILKFFSHELQQYSFIFTCTAACLLLIASVGPVTGLLQMTGGEHVCNRNQWISIGIMIAIWLVFHKQSLFAVYGLCGQAVVEGVLKYYSVCKWFGKSIIPMTDYVVLWMPVIGVRIVVELLGLNYSLIAFLVCICFVGGWNVSFILKDSMVKDAMDEVFKKVKRE